MTAAPFRYRGRTALITGAAGTLGSAFASALAQRGCRLLLVDRNAEGLERLLKSLPVGAGGAHAALTCDLTRADDVGRVVAAAITAEPPVSLLINNAGILHAAPWHLLPVDASTATVRLHIEAPLRLTHPLSAAMRARGDGAIINVSSATALVPLPNAAVYAASKAFLLSWSEALWAEHRRSGVRVLAVCPGLFGSGLFPSAGLAYAGGIDAGRGPRRIVAESLAALEAGGATLVPGAAQRLNAALVRMLPRALAVRRAAHAFRRAVRRPSDGRAAAAPSAAGLPPTRAGPTDVFRDRTALVTGASRGLGEALAAGLARRGCRLILTARTAADLDRVAEALAGTGAPRPEVIVADLSTDEGIRRVADAVAALGRPVDILVNNAGFGAYGRWEDLDLERQVSMVRLNVEACLRLAHLFLPGMIERRGGGVLNVASLGGYLPMPTGAVYGASKAFLLSWSEALHYELRKTGVRVTALCPGPVRTRYAAAAGIRYRGGSRAAGPVAEAGLEAYAAGRSTVVPGFLPGLAALLPRVFSRAGTALWAARVLARRVKIGPGSAEP